MREIGIELRRGKKTASEVRGSGIELRRGKRTEFEMRELELSRTAFEEQYFKIRPRTVRDFFNTLAQRASRN